MVGYINEFGFLVARENETGNLNSSIWKPVDEIDESKRQCDVGEFVKPIPYDAGNHIAFKYVKMFDKQYYNKQIVELKQQLADSDYQITKCYEASLTGQELPYDITELHASRQSLRDQINQLEERISNA